MDNMFNLFKKEDTTAHQAFELAVAVDEMRYLLERRVELLEKHLGVEYFNGGKNKPHYRSKRTRKSK